MSIVITFEITARNEQMNNLKTLFTDTLADTRKFDGCIKVELHTEIETTDTFFMIEEWISRTAYDKYLAWRQERGDMEKLMSFVTGEPVIRFFNKI